MRQEAARPDQEPQVPPLREAEASPHGGEGQQAPRLAVLPVKVGALPNRLGQPPTGRHLLVLPVQHPDPGASFQELPPMEEPAEDPLDDRPGSDEKASRPYPGQGPYKYRGAARRRAVQPGGTRLANTDVGRTPGPPVAGEEDSEASEASEWEEGEREEVGGDEGGG